MQNAPTGHHPLDEMITDGICASLIFFDSSGVDANVNPGHANGEPYLRIISRVSSLYKTYHRGTETLRRERKTLTKGNSKSNVRSDRCITF